MYCMLSVISAGSDQSAQVTQQTAYSLCIVRRTLVLGIARRFHFSQRLCAHKNMDTNQGEGSFKHLSNKHFIVHAQFTNEFWSDDGRKKSIFTLLALCLLRMQVLTVKFVIFAAIHCLSFPAKHTWLFFSQSGFCSFLPCPRLCSYQRGNELLICSSSATQ